MRRPYRIYLDHGEAYGNLGDEAMLLNAIDRLNNDLGPCEFVIPAEPGMPLPPKLPSVTIVCPPHRILQRLARWFKAPAWFLGCLGRAFQFPDHLYWRMAAILAEILRGYPRLSRLLAPELGKFLAILKSCDAFYGVGAADFTDYWQLGIVYKTWLYRTAGSCVPVRVLSSQGLGPVTPAWARRAMRNAFSRLDLLSFRDVRDGAALVQRLGTRHVRCRVVCDEAWTLAAGPEREPIARQLLADAGLPDGRPFIATHFRLTDYTRDTSDLVPRLAMLLDRVLENVSESLVFFPMSYHRHSLHDEECGRSIRAAMRHADRLHVAPVCRDVRVIKRAIGKARFSLGLSYHVHVFSLSQGHPAIVIYSGEYYRAKSQGLIGFFGSPCAAFDLNKVSDDAILDGVMDLMRNHERACDHVEMINRSILQENDWTLREMRLLLEERRNPCHTS